jgi:hypothetical protein
MEMESFVIVDDVSVVSSSVYVMTYQIRLCVVQKISLEQEYVCLMKFSY